MESQVHNNTSDDQLKNKIADNDINLYELEGCTGDVLLIFFDSSAGSNYEADHKEYFKALQSSCSAPPVKLGFLLRRQLVEGIDQKAYIGDPRN